MYLYYLNFFIVMVLLIIIGMWIRMFYLWIRSVRYSPKLIEKNVKFSSPQPKVSIIISARNEEKHIKKCIESLLNQDYPNFELILVNDGSTDNTLNIVNQIRIKDDRVKVIDIKSKPAGWVGTNWPIFQGYLISNGEILLFSEADTYHMRNTTTLCVQYLIENKLDALNLLPRSMAHDFSTKLILPMHSIHRHTFCSPVDANDPKKKKVYFLGTYYLIKRDVYKKIGTHASFRDNIDNDFFIGKKLKELKFKMKQIRGEFHLRTDSLRSWKWMYNQISRITIPNYQENRWRTVRNTLALLTLEFSPLVLLVYSIIVTQFKDSRLFPETVALILSFVTILIMIVLCSFQSRYVLYQNALYGLGAPLAGCLYSFAYALGLAKAIGKASITWR
jgi:glycosyltransferase involved in cell wall biosynthesis